MKIKFSISSLERLKPRDKRYDVWDTEIKGFGVRVHPTGKISFVATVRYFGNTKRKKLITLGEYGKPLTLSKARELAVDALLQLAAGIDPSAVSLSDDLTLNDFSAQFSSDTAYRKKPRSIEAEQSLLSRHILPRIGDRPVAELSSGDISTFMRSVANQKKPLVEKTKARGKAVVSGGAATANRARDVLSAMMTHAIELGIRSDNPVTTVKPFKKTKRERYLSVDEFDRLGQALKARKQSGDNIFAIAAIQVLLLTGARKNEILSLKWSYIDRENMIASLPDSKTGAKPLFLPHAALSVLDALPQLENSEWVFPSTKTTGHLVGLQKIWNRVRAQAGLEDVRIHDLRHSFASVGAMSGESLYIVGKLLGQSNPTTTQRYAHLANSPVQKAANSISDAIQSRLGNI